MGGTGLDDGGCEDGGFGARLAGWRVGCTVGLAVNDCEGTVGGDVATAGVGACVPIETGAADGADEGGRDGAEERESGCVVGALFGLAVGTRKKLL